MGAPRVLALLLLLVPAAAAQQPSIALGDWAAIYGPEAWKDEPALGPVGGVLGGTGALPPASGVLVNPYAGNRPHQGGDAWLGARFEAVLQAVTAQGRNDTQPGLSLSATIVPVAGGMLPVKVVKEGPGTFRVVADLDGENGRPDVPVVNGPFTLTATLSRFSDPVSGSLTIASGAWAFGIQRGTLGLPVVPMAEQVLLGYADAGPGDFVPVVPFGLSAGPTLNLTLRFGDLNGTATVYGYHRSTGRALGDATIRNGVGTVRVSLADVVADQGLGALAATFRASETPMLGSTVAMVPVGTAETRVVKFAYEGQGPGSPLSALLVTVNDPGGAGMGPARGSLFLLDPLGAVIASAPYPPTAFLPTLQQRTGLVPLEALENHTRYLVVSVLQNADGSVYSMAEARRGLSLRAQPTRVGIGQDGVVTATLENLNDNFDATDTPDLAFDVNVTFSDLPGVGTVSQRIRIGEATIQSVSVPVRGDVEGAYPVTITVVADEFLLTDAATVFIGRAGEAGSLNLLPLPAVLAVLALVLQRRRRV